MVDIVFYKQFCPAVIPAKDATPAKEEASIPLSSLSQTEKPCRQFFLLLPSKVMGFSMQSKRRGKTLQQLFSRYTDNKLSSLSQSCIHLAHCLECASLR